MSEKEIKVVNYIQSNTFDYIIICSVFQNYICIVPFKNKIEQNRVFEKEIYTCKKSLFWHKGMYCKDDGTICFEDQNLNTDILQNKINNRLIEIKIEPNLNFY